jgi:hypothetical protein
VYIRHGQHGLHVVKPVVILPFKLEHGPFLIIPHHTYAQSACKKDDAKLCHALWKILLITLNDHTINLKHYEHEQNVLLFSYCITLFSNC